MNDELPFFFEELPEPKTHPVKAVPPRPLWYGKRILLEDDVQDLKSELENLKTKMEELGGALAYLAKCLKPKEWCVPAGKKF